MKKYTIKNCPAILSDNYCNKDTRDVHCKNVPNCILKQLVDKFKDCSCELINFLEIEEENE